ncbi:MAG: energy-coupling factor transporter transmembrane component T, partial [Bowdeniella nasicola]|nr:energy-coupling factor transporter transmembrane component T [Bowdeniella nasicola]
VAVPSMVMIRFFPVAIAELRAINDAMVLRGLRPGLGGMVTHPLRTGELLMIPFLASSARIADELAAAALIKGVGRSRDRTTIVTLHWHVADVVVAIVMLALLGWMVMTL